MLKNNENEIEKLFLNHFAATENDPDSVGEQAKLDSEDLKAASDALSVGDSGDKNPEEGDNLLGGESSDKPAEKFISWDNNFSIILDPQYMEEVEETFAGQAEQPAGEAVDKTLERKVQAPSWYIWCKPLNKRVEGKWDEKVLGGHGTKEKMQDDLRWMRKMSPQGLPQEFVDDLLVPTSSPTILTEQVREDIQKEQKKLTTTQPSQEENAMGQEKEFSEEKKPMARPKPAIPEPVGEATKSKAAHIDYRKEIILRAAIKNRS